MTRSLRLLLLSVFVAGGLHAQTPAIGEGGIVNGASFAAGPVARGSLISLFGTELASGLSVAGSIPLSTDLGGVRVLFDDMPAPIVFVSSQQINLQVPWGVAGGGSGAGVSSVVVERSGVRSAPVAVQVGASSPGVFALPQPEGPSLAIAIHQDGSLSAPEDSIPGTATRPTQRGEALIILATGLGETDPPGIAGTHSLDANGAFVQRDTLARPTVLIGEVAVAPFFSGLSPQFVGVNQLNVLVPADAPAGDAIPLQLRVGDFTSTDQVTVAIAAAP